MPAENNSNEANWNVFPLFQSCFGNKTGANDSIIDAIGCNITSSKREKKRYYENKNNNEEEHEEDDTKKQSNTIRYVCNDDDEEEGDSIHNKRERDEFESSSFIDEELSSIIVAMLPPPTTKCYRVVASKDECILSKLCWGRSWDKLLEICQNKRYKKEIFCKTKDSNRTPLHLSTLSNNGCPYIVAKTLLQLNPYAILVQDTYYSYTPLHNVCAFQSDSRRRINDNHNHNYNNTGNNTGSNRHDIDDENKNDNNDNNDRLNIVSLFCKTVIVVEQRLRQQHLISRNKKNEKEDTYYNFYCHYCDGDSIFNAEGNEKEKRTAEKTIVREAEIKTNARKNILLSPLYLACKRNACIGILHTLIKTRKFTNWIAPRTGGEPYYHHHHISHTQEYYPDFNSNQIKKKKCDREEKRNDVDCKNESRLPSSAFSPLQILLHSREFIFGNSKTNILNSQSKINNMMKLTVYNLNNEKRNIMSSSSEKRDCGDCGNSNDFFFFKSSTERLENDGKEVTDEEFLTQSEQDAFNLWGKVLLLLKEFCPKIIIPMAITGTSSKSTDCTAISTTTTSCWGIMNSVAKLKVPIPFLFQFVCELFPEQISQQRSHTKYLDKKLRQPFSSMGNDDNQCFHYSNNDHNDYRNNEHPLVSIIQIFFNLSGRTNNKNSNDDTVIGKQLLTIILDCHHSKDHDYRIPREAIYEAFVLALSRSNEYNGECNLLHNNNNPCWDDILYQLMLADMNILVTRDKDTNLFPFQLAAAASFSTFIATTDGNSDNIGSNNYKIESKDDRSSRITSLDTIYRLLSTCPQLVTVIN